MLIGCSLVFVKVHGAKQVFLILHGL